jgi:hypothetical protein
MERYLKTHANILLIIAAVCLVCLTMSGCERSKHAGKEGAGHEKGKPAEHVGKKRARCIFTKEKTGKTGKTAKSHGAPSFSKKDIHIQPASGENAITIEAAYRDAKKLDGKQVVLRAQVVKITKNILGKNWLHCQDGTGSADKHNFDITVTTSAAPEPGSTILIKGTLHKDRDIGAGYFYPVIIEDANVTSEG